MGFHNTRFPDDISYGSRGGPGFNTQVIQLDSGATQRITRWEEPLHTFNVAYGVKEQPDLYALKTFFYARQGATHSFRYKDWSDYATTSDGINDDRSSTTPTKDDIIIGTGDGTETQFQLVKKYVDPIVTRTRNITLPVDGTVLIAVDGVLQTEGGGDDYTIDYETGIVTFNSAVTNGDDVTWGGEFDLHCAFSDGTDDVLQLSIDSFGAQSVPNIVVEEVRDPTPIQDEFWFGGAKDHGDLTGDIDITLQNGRVQVLKPTVASLKGKLQRTDDIPFGGPVWYLVHKGSFDMDIVNQDDTVIVTMSSDDIVEILIAPDSGGDKSYLSK